MRAFKILCVLLMISGFIGCISEGGEEEQNGANLQVGDRLPQFTVDMNDGSALNSTSLEGKVSVIMLFSVTCNHCKSQFPVTEEVYKRYKDNDNVVMFGVSREQGENAVSGFWKRNAYIMPYSAQDDRYIYSLFASSIVPRIYISDRNRIIRKITLDNPLATFEELTTAIDALLTEKP